MNLLKSSPLKTKISKPIPNGRQVQAQRGIASLPVVLLLGGIIVEAAIAGAFVLYFISGDVYGDRLNTQAFEIARSAIDDGILRVMSNPDCGIDTSGCPNPYTITAGGSTATVTICKDTCPGQGTGITQISSVGSALGKKHSLKATLSVSSTLPLVTVQSIVDQE
jgi:hypothetical protein